MVSHFAPNACDACVDATFHTFVDIRFNSDEFTSNVVASSNVLLPAAIIIIISGGDSFLELKRDLPV